MVVTEIQLYEALADHLGKEKARTLTEYIETKVEKQLNDKTSVFATKEDLAKLEVRVSEAKAELIKWMFIFWASQLVAMFGFLKFFR